MVTGGNGDELGREAYSLICSRDGVTAREIAAQLGVPRKDVNRVLYGYPFISDLCYHDADYRWHGYIRQTVPHDGLRDYSGWYGFVAEFMDQDEDGWLDELCEGCSRIGRNLNDTRGLLHSFTDTRQVMRDLFDDLADFGVECGDWELAFEPRIRRARRVRIYADVLVIAPEAAFSLEFKMKDVIDSGEVDQAAKYAPYLEVVLGQGVEVVPALVLTRAADLYEHERASGGTRVAVSSADLLFNVFDERLGFLADAGI